MVSLVVSVNSLPSISYQKFGDIFLLFLLAKYFLAMGLLARVVYRSSAHLANSLDPDGVGELLLLRALPLPHAGDDHDDDDHGGDDDDDHGGDVDDNDGGDDDDNGGDDYGNGFGSYDEEPLTKRVFTGQ